MDRTCIFEDGNGNELFRITFDSVVYNTDTGKQTWRYHITKSSGKVSNLALQLCKEAEVSDSYPEAEVGDPNKGQGKGNCLSINNKCTSTVVDKQIKWEITEEFRDDFFEFTLDKKYQVGEVDVAIKTGKIEGEEGMCFCCKILGPICGTPEVGRGILFKT